ncbi:hypothetical protein B0I35DRAFT_413967 [Stachybotrys elegans]|uniref:lytic cellulose monooxygenase (C4-dehydrogenating) n=1 Tax=Stachybotrys elegans TaxID=80388 RepID=A0A8K0WKL7_9HYPO|nr:hypothetical protein B0I35DRAFT_413967 [Stachybotrys elegans]
MKSILAFTLLAAPLAQAHYIFTQLIHNGRAVGGDYTYVRKNNNEYNPSFTSEVVGSSILRCNKGAQPGNTQTYTAAPGDRLALKLWYNEFIEHPGPGFVYMSKAPGSVNSYDGSGDWFKVYESGLCGSNPGRDADWCTWQKDRIEFTIPQGTPPGEYLVRWEHIGLHEGHVGKAQFYMECAQIKITGNGNGQPGPLVKIPGVYSANDPGIAYNKWGTNLKPYVMPGPAVWRGGSSGGGGNDGGSGGGGGGGGGGGATAPLYGQCGGQGWTGPTLCAQGTCKASNEWYSHRLEEVRATASLGAYDIIDLLHFVNSRHHCQAESINPHDAKPRRVLTATMSHTSLMKGAPYPTRMSYSIGRGEQGVLTFEPYKSELLPLWRFRTLAAAQQSAADLWEKFEAFDKDEDFVGMDMTRKFIQMGYTRSKRYANHAGGRKYKRRTREVLPLSSDHAGKREKEAASQVFLKTWERCRAHEGYQARRAAFLKEQREWQKKQDTSDTSPKSNDKRVKFG